MSFFGKLLGLSALIAWLAFPSLSYAEGAAGGGPDGRLVFPRSKALTRGSGCRRRSRLVDVLESEHYQRRKWGIHYNLWTGSDRIDTDEIMLNPEAGPETEFWTIMVEWRY